MSSVSSVSSYGTFAAQLMAEARDYVSATFGGIETHDMPADSIRAAVEHTFPGGWAALSRDVKRNLVTTEPLSPMKQLAIVRNFTSHKIREYDRILTCEVTPTTMKFVLDIATVERLTRTDRVTARTLHMYVFTRATSTDAWGAPRHLAVDNDTDEGFIRYGTVMTPERAASIAEQFETCYRPGTESSPMSGWVARADMSHAQAHESESYPTFTTKER